jgi:hypothetical protein
MTILSITCPIPCGVFAPTFFLGAGFGRLYGYLMHIIFGIYKNLGVYSIIGAVSVTASVTHTISVAVIAFELNGQLTHMMPLLIGTLIAYAVGTSLSMSIFDVLLELKNLPFLPALRSPELYSKVALDIMNTNYLFLTNQSTLADIALLLQYVGNKPKLIPVLQSLEQKYFFL